MARAARKTKDAVGESAADGSNLTPEQEERALLLHHFDKLRQQEQKAAEQKVLYDAEREVLTDLFRVAKSDGFTRKELQALLDDTKSLRRDLTAEEERRAKLRAWVGLPAGTQLDLFNSPLETQDEQHAQGQGYAAGLRGEPGVAPEHIHARFVQAFMRGWGVGQEELAWALSAAGRVIDRKRGDNANPVAPESEETGDDESPEAALDEEAERLAETGWTERSPEEAEFESEAV